MCYRGIETYERAGVFFNLHVFDAQLWDLDFNNSERIAVMFSYQYSFDLDNKSH
jgi:hypothetical protein